MYTIEYLPLALEDLKEIVYYIAHTLKNPTAAENLGQEIIKKINLLADFPYSSPSHKSMKSLSHEYRKLPVKNYFIFYWINEEKRIVTIARVIYARRNIIALIWQNTTCVLLCV